jgi:pSer/pThr/pTyr-binding forkhead associated (FHA) protein
MVDPLENQFIEACGLTDALRLEVTTEGEVARDLCLNRPFAVVGRGVHTDVVLDHSVVSKRHAYLQFLAGRVFCVDLGSRFGVRWEHEVKESGWLGAGGSIGIGPYNIRLVQCNQSDDGTPAGSTDPIEPLTEPSAGPDALPLIVLQALNVKGKPTWRVDPALALVGRSPQCLVSIPEPLLSRFHCSLLRTMHGVWALDLLGQGGMLVDGQSVRFAQLADGNELGVGNVRFLVRSAVDDGLNVPAKLGVRTLSSRTPYLSPKRTRPFLPLLFNAVSSNQTPAERVDRTRAQGADFVVPRSDPFAELVIQQLGQMQQQLDDVRHEMSDQFQQVLLMVFQSLGAMQREHLGAVHEELVQFRKLTQELHALTNDSPPGARASESSGVARRPDARKGPQASRPATAGPLHPPRTGQPQRPGVLKVVPVAPRRDAPPNAESVLGKTQEPANGSATSEQAASSDDDMHAILSRRISELQREQQSRWQRILKMIGVP